MIKICTAKVVYREGQRWRYLYGRLNSIYKNIFFSYLHLINSNGIKFDYYLKFCVVYDQHIACCLDDYINVMYAPTIATSETTWENEELKTNVAKEKTFKFPSTICNIGNCWVHIFDQ